MKIMLRFVVLLLFLAGCGGGRWVNPDLSPTADAAKMLSMDTAICQKECDIFFPQLSRDSREPLDRTDPTGITQTDAYVADWMMDNDRDTFFGRCMNARGWTQR